MFYANWNRHQNSTRSFGIILNHSENKNNIINLQNHKSLVNALQLIPRNFIITTENGLSKFNIDILKFSSPTIFQYCKCNPNKSEYHLKVFDDKNVLSKLEQLYQGKPVIIKKDEHLIFDQIIIILQIQKRSDNYIQDKSIKAIIDYGSLINILKTKESFIIKTNKNEYKCNHIGINLSSTIKEFLATNPNSDNYSYNFPDEFNEFQIICDFFNFKLISITTNNMDSVRKIAEELKINLIFNETGNFIDTYDKFYKLVDDQQESMDEINELFDLLCNIKVKTVKSVKESILQSKWSQKEEDVQELGAFILQVISSNLTLHQYLIDLLIQLDSESIEQSKLKILLPLIVKELMSSFGANIQNCSFVYLLYKKGIISKQDLFNLLYKKLTSFTIDADLLSNKDNNNNDNNNDKANNPNINHGPLFTNNYWGSKNDTTDVKMIELIKVNTPILLWFLPEIIEIRKLKSTNKLRGYGLAVDSFIKVQFNQIDQYKKMRDKGEPIDELTLALRNDDIDKFQSIISVGHFKVDNGIIPYNIYEEFVPYGKTKYLNYAAAYGSVKCFKYLLLNYSKVDKQTFKLAIYGGNIEIIKIVEQKYQDDNIFDQQIDDDKNRRNTSSQRRSYSFRHNDNCFFTRQNGINYNNVDVSNFINETVNNNGFTYSIVPSIVRHQNDLFDWILEKNLELKSIDKYSFKDLIMIFYESGNAHSLIELFDKYFEFMKNTFANTEEKKSLFADMIETTCRKGYYLLTKILLKSLEFIISKDQLDSFLMQSVYGKSFYNQDNLLYDPLHINGTIELCTMSFGNLSILKLFISHYDQQNLENLLIHAINFNNVNIVTYIFDSFVKTNALKITENNSELFISYSLFQKSDYLFNYIMEQIKQFNPSLNIKWSINMVKNAAYSNNVQVAKFVTDMVFKENPKEDFSIPFINAVSSKSVELCNYFIEKKVFLSFKQIKNHLFEICKANKETFSILMNVIPQKTIEKTLITYILIQYN